MLDALLAEGELFVRAQSACVIIRQRPVSFRHVRRKLFVWRVYVDELFVRGEAPLVRRKVLVRPKPERFADLFVRAPLARHEAPVLLPAARGGGGG